MEIVRIKLENGLDRAEEYWLLGKNHPEGLKIHIEYITDLAKPLIAFLRSQPNRLNSDDNFDYNELLADAKRTLINLRSELDDAARGVVGPALPRVREKLETFDQKLPSFDGQPDEYHCFLIRFHDVFSKVSTSDAAKLIFLKTCLTGELFDFVNALPVSRSNFSHALNLLRNLFSNTHESLYTRRQYRRLIALPQVSMNDGARFQKTFWTLENILELTMSHGGVNVDEDLCLRCLYLTKFSEKTLTAIFVDDSEMSLPEIRRKIRHLVHVEEFHPKIDGNTNENADKQRVASEVSVEKSTIDNGRKEVSAATADENESVQTKRKDLSESDDQSSAKKSKVVMPHSFLFTVCTNVRNANSGENMSVRLLLVKDAPVNLITEAAAKQLGIQVPPWPLVRTLHLRSSLGFEFTATQAFYTLLLQVGEKERFSIDVHIVDNKYNFSADDVPGADTDKFLMEHPQFSHKKSKDTGRGRPVDFFLSERSYWQFTVPPKNADIPSIRLNSRWHLRLTKFGWLLSSSESVGKVNNFSYWYPEDEIYY